MNLKLNLNGFTPKQYAALILRDDLNYSYGRMAIKLDCTRDAAAELYKRAKHKEHIKNHEKTTKN